MFESPFLEKKVAFKREPTTWERWKSSILEKLDEWFVQAIPSDEIKQMPKEYLYPLGFVLIAMILSVFFAIFVTQYLDLLATQYLSPSDNSRGECEDVSIANTGLYLADQKGQWASSEGFQFSQAAYYLDIYSLSLTKMQYSDLMNVIYQELQSIGEKAVNQDLAINLLYWMAYVLASIRSASQRFYLIGEPVSIFAIQKTVGGLSNVYSDCTNISLSKFDKATGIFELSYDYLQYQSNSACQNLLDPDLLGYTSYANSQEFTVTVDSQALVTALAVNLGILSIKDLQTISSEAHDFSFEGVTYNATAYANPQFPYMSPISCSQFNSTICGVELGTLVGLPLFHHIGQSEDYPIPCNCSYFHEHNITLQSNDSAYNLCNSFKFITGMLFYNTTDPTPLYELTNKYSASELLAQSFDAMFLGSVWGVNSPYRSDLSSPENRSKAYDFCYSSRLNISCSFLIFSSFEIGYEAWDISPYYYQLENGACVDSFTTTPENW